MLNYNSLRKIKKELMNNEMYLSMIKYNHAINTLKYFGVVFLILLLINIINRYIPFVADYFNFLYLSLSIIGLVLLCQTTLFEKKLIKELATQNNCLTLEDFYQFILEKKRGGK